MKFVTGFLAVDADFFEECETVTEEKISKLWKEKLQSKWRKKPPHKGWRSRHRERLLQAAPGLRERLKAKLDLRGLQKRAREFVQTGRSSAGNAEEELASTASGLDAAEEFEDAVGDWDEKVVDGNVWGNARSYGGCTVRAGAPAGSATTSRKRTEKALLACLENFFGQEDEEEDEDEDEDEDDESLLAAVKKIVDEARKNGTRGLKAKLKELIKGGDRSRSRSKGQDTKRSRSRSRSQSRSRRKGKGNGTKRSESRSRSKEPQQRAAVKNKEEVQRGAKVTWASKVQEDKTIKRLRLDKTIAGVAKGELLAHKMLVQKLEEDGTVPETAKISIMSWQEAEAVRLLAQQLDTKVKFSLIIDGEGKTEEPLWGKEHPQKVYRYFEFEKLGPKRVAVLPLHDEPGLADFKMQQKVHLETAAPAAKEAKTLRIQIFKRYINDETWKSFKRKPQQAVDANILADKAFIQNDWQVLGEGDEAHVLGYIRVPKAESEKVEKLGGQGGVFIEKLRGEEEKREPCDWVTRAKEETEKEYFGRALKEANQAGLPLIFRRGGGACLGIKGQNPRRKAGQFYLARNIPHDWGPAAVEEFLKTKGFLEVKNLAPPKFKAQGWLFNAQRAEGEHNFFSIDVFPIAGGQSIVIRHWTRRQPEAQEGKRIGKKGWTQATKEGKDEDMEDGSKSSEAAKETGEKEEEKDPNKEADVSAEVKAKRQAEASAEGTAKIQKTAARATRPNEGPGGCKELDFGGTGDCGWRCLAGDMALLNGRSLEDVKGKIVTLGTGLRVKAAVHLKDTFDDWKDGWVVDQNTKPEWEDGTPITTAKELLEAIQSRKHRYICGYGIGAAAMVTESDVIIMAPDPKDKTKWRRAGAFLRGDKLTSSHKRIKVLTLVDRHYRLVERPASGRWPDEIGGKVQKSDPNSVDYRAAGQEDEEEDVEAEQDNISDWLRPAASTAAASSATAKRRYRLKRKTTMAAPKELPRDVANEEDLDDWIAPLRNEDEANSEDAEVQRGLSAGGGIARKMHL